MWRGDEPLASTGIRTPERPARSIVNILTMQWVSNRRSTTFYYRNWYIWHKNYTFSWLSVPYIAIWQHAACEPTHNNGRGPMP